MFQYAAALVISKTHSVFLTPIQENKHSGRDYRETLYYRISSGAHSQNEIVLDAFTPWTPTQFPEFPIAIRGYFQYLPSIEPILPLLKSDLIEFLTPQREAMRVKYSLTNLMNIGFIHVRRGDYLTAPPGFSTLDYKAYYTSAIVKAPSVSRWLVISDDISWCRQQPMFSSFEIADEPDELAGLALMSLCHGAAIIANSTYSWWGAILGPQTTQKVIYPLNWLDNTLPNIFPSFWLGI